MYNDRLYADGVHSMLLAEWELLCNTPLVIRNGHQIAYTDSALTKTRNCDLQLKWQAKDGQGYEVAALHYGYEILGGQVYSYHFVPPSSIRGALRSWSIRNLVYPALYPALNPVPKDDADGVAAHKACVRKGLAKRDTGCELIASLFGLAADEGEADTPSNAGRLHIGTERFTGTGLQPVDVSGVSMETSGGPGNVRREMSVRNPLDRMTHASVDGGLHRYLEVTRGETFKVHLRIINPLDCDLGLLGLWVRELNDGMLRIGALSSIGRGRMEVRKQTYELWRRPDAPRLQGHAFLQDEAGGRRNNDVLAGLWAPYIVPSDALLKFTDYLKDFTGGGANASLS
jgi:CRISPR/Cas system CSM-associated protein Csm3 (group 7 of RAMP superfamily)